MALGSALTLSALLLGCSADDTTGGLPGTWGNDNAGKPECGALGRVCLAAPFDAPLAVGSATELRLDLAAAGGGGLAIELTSLDPSVIETQDLTITANAAGGTTVLFSADGAVLDWLYLFASAIDALRVVVVSQQGDIVGFASESGQLLVGDQVYFAVAPYAAGAPLAGNFPLDIQIQGTSVRVVPDVTLARYRMIATEVGTSTVTFAALDHQATWTLEVLP